MLVKLEYWGVIKVSHIDCVLSYVVGEHYASWLPYWKWDHFPHGKAWNRHRCIHSCTHQQHMWAQLCTGQFHSLWIWIAIIMQFCTQKTNTWIISFPLCASKSRYKVDGGWFLLLWASLLSEVTNALIQIFACQTFGVLLNIRLL